MNKTVFTDYVKTLDYGGITKFLFSIIAIVAANLPILFGWFIFWLLGPVGFWQILCSLVFLVIVLIAPQIWFWIFGASVLLALLD